MEFLNKVELKGIVGRVSELNVQDQCETRFSIVTQYAYINEDGEQAIETTWFGCVYLAPKESKPSISNGDKVHIIGRVRVLRYSADDGSVRDIHEVIVNEVEIIRE